MTRELLIEGGECLAAADYEGAVRLATCARDRLDERSDAAALLRLSGAELTDRAILF